MRGSFNKTFKAKIFQVLTSKCLDRNRWSCCIDLALHDYRFSVHSTTKFRPVDLFFSFKCRGFLPFTLSKSTLSAAERMQRSRFRAKKFYDRRAVSARFFKKGEKVLLRNPSSRTFEPKVVIAQVVQDISPECVKVRFPNGRIDQVNKSRISRFIKKHKEGNSGSVDIFDPPQIEPCRTSDAQSDCSGPGLEARNNDQKSDEPERPEGNDGAARELRRSRRVRFQTLPFDASDPRDPQLLKWGKVVSP